MEQNLQLKLFRQLFRKEDEKGFSLIELVVVVAVLAVLAGIALPTFTCITRKAKATSALAALKQIQTECAVKQEEEEGTSATFVTSNLQGYEIESEGSNSCNGSSGTGLIRALPNEPDQLPTFILATNTNELTCSFRGATGTNFTDCLDLICGDGGSSGSSVLGGDSTGNGSVEVVANLPPNESTLFGSDSGLSCREVKSYSTAIGTGGMYFNGQPERQVILQPVTINIGDQSWLVKDVDTTIYEHFQPFCTDPNHPANCNQWKEDFAKKTVSVINESEGNYSAEIDPNNPSSVKIYSPTGTLIDDIKTEVDMSVGGWGVNSLGGSNFPYAYPSFDTTDMDEGKTTTVCDGR